MKSVVVHLPVATAKRRPADRVAEVIDAAERDAAEATRRLIATYHYLEAARAEYRAAVAATNRAHEGMRRSWRLGKRYGISVRPICPGFSPKTVELSPVLVSLRRWRGRCDHYQCPEHGSGYVRDTGSRNA